jgi:ubiquinone/menaquinone biosynthesis C-methylase UbiE
VTNPTHATSERFGYGWVAGGRPAAMTAPVPYHLHAMQAVLGAPALTGRVLDAGCGEGIDLASVALTTANRAVGVELSDGGIAATSARIAALPTAGLIQGNVLMLPFADRTFDGAYSYGVVHHTVDPEKAVREIARVLKPGAPLLLYVYEDFSSRSLSSRATLAAINTGRRIVAAMSPANIRRFCAVIAPIVFVTCTWPSRHFAFAKAFPYPATQNPTLRSLIPDLYDRFAAPIEERYSESGARRLAEQAGCRVRRSAFLRGWAVWAEKI